MTASSTGQGQGQGQGDTGTEGRWAVGVVGVVPGGDVPRKCNEVSEGRWVRAQALKLYRFLRIRTLPQNINIGARDREIRILVGLRALWPRND
jgi:hypothetical protein